MEHKLVALCTIDEATGDIDKVADLKINFPIEFPHDFANNDNRSYDDMCEEIVDVMRQLMLQQITTETLKQLGMIPNG